MGKNTLFPDLSCLGALKNALYWLFMGMWKDQPTVTFRLQQSPKAQVIVHGNKDFVLRV